MTKTTAVVAASFVHIFLRLTIFLEPDYKGGSPQTPTSSWLFLLSILEILWDTEFIPNRYTILPQWCLWWAEVFICVFLMEFFIIVIWFNLEKLIYRSLKRAIVVAAPTLKHPQGDFLVELITIMLSICILYNASQGTDVVYRLRRRFRKNWKNLKGKTSGVLGSSSLLWLNQLKKSVIMGDPTADIEDGLKVICHRRPKNICRSSKGRKITRI